MKKNGSCKAPFWAGHTKLLVMAKLTILLLLVACLQAYSKGYSQGKVTLEVKQAPLQKVFKELKRQTGYLFMYRDEWMSNAKPVDLNVKNASLEEVLQLCLHNQPLTYELINKTVVIRQKNSEQAVSEVLFSTPIEGPIKGVITDENGQPIAGANITVRGTNKIVTTNHLGEYILNDVAEGAVLEVTYVGYETKTLAAKSGAVINTSLAISSKELDVAIVQAYGTTTRRLSTGNIGKVSKDDIEKQPVSNPLGALEGRVPGMEVVQSTGTPGGAFKVRIRGITSVGATSVLFPVSNDPLFIIDGVPFAPNNSSQTGINTTAPFGESGGLSPFVNINPLDIESVEVLKDADATAIYGSRGANGVILITTKKGRAGKSQLQVRMQTGFNKVGRSMRLLNTEEYLKIRKEAFTNDGIVPDINNAPELLVFDQNKYTDFNKELTDDVAYSSNVQASFSGGNKNNQFFLSSGYSSESTVYGSDPSNKRFSNTRISVLANFNHVSTDNKLAIYFGSNYSFYNGNLTGTDPSGKAADFAPNYPDFFDANNNLVWEYKGYPMSNPFANLFQRYKSTPDNLIANSKISYAILPGLQIRATFGYNVYQLDEKYLLPRKGENPNYGYKNSAEFSTTKSRSLIAEPQLEYAKALKKMKIDILVGATLQKNTSSNYVQGGKDFISDDLLENIKAADPTTLYASNKSAEYKYAAGFGRANLNWQDRYIINLSGRRDGSSRFGPNKQFSNYGAIGLAWIFSNEKWMQSMSFVSFGKIRASYGTTGNDKIGDYKFLNTWTSINGYQSSSGLYPSALYNPDFSWELNKKLEASIDLGFLSDRILTSFTWYRNRSNNQLINYKLPAQTGFSSVIENFPALVQNEGIEVELKTINIKSKSLTWSTAFNISRNNNKLIDFPNLSTSSYATSLIVGQPLTIVKGFHLIGVDPATGVYKFEDVNGDNLINALDQKNISNNVPKFFGGLRNEINYKSIGLSFFISFKKQTGKNYLSEFGVPALGIYNPPAYILGNYWQKPGDETKLQKLTQNPGSPAAMANNSLINSDGVWSDASYIRVKNIELSYGLPTEFLKRAKIRRLTIFIQAQNLFTITKYKGNDPENASFSALPPLKAIVGGLNINL